MYPFTFRILANVNATVKLPHKPLFFRIKQFFDYSSIWVRFWKSTEICFVWWMVPTWRNSNRIQALLFSCLACRLPQWFQRDRHWIKIGALAFFCISKFWESLGGHLRKWSHCKNFTSDELCYFTHQKVAFWHVFCISKFWESLGGLLRKWSHCKNFTSDEL